MWSGTVTSLTSGVVWEEEPRCQRSSPCLLGLQMNMSQTLKCMAHDPSKNSARFWDSPGRAYSSFRFWLLCLFLYTLSVQSRTINDTLKAVCFLKVHNIHGDVRGSFSPFQTEFLIPFLEQEQNKERIKRRNKTKTGIFPCLFLEQFFLHLSSHGISRPLGLGPMPPFQEGSLKNYSPAILCFPEQESWGIQCFLVPRNDSTLSYSHHSWWFN